MRSRELNEPSDLLGSLNDLQEYGQLLCEWPVLPFASASGKIPCDPSALLASRSIEIIVRGIWSFGFCAAMGFVTSAARRLATFGVNALDRGHAAQHACARMGCRSQEQPWNRTCFGRVSATDYFPDNLAAISMFPRRSGVVRSDVFSVCIIELCFRPFKRPGEFLVGGSLAHIDL